MDEVKDVLGAKDLSCHTCLEVFEDNNGALIVATTPQMTPQSKHIAMKYYFFNKHVRMGKIQIHKVSSNQQLTDCTTKGLEKPNFERAQMLLTGW